MNYTVVSSSEWTYPDKLYYTSRSDKIILDTPRNSYATAQIIFSEINPNEKAPVSAKLKLEPFNLNVDFYEMIPVYVEANPHITPENSLPHYPERIAPYYIYDCLKPLELTLNVINGIAGIYLSVKVPKEIEPGNYKGEVIIEISGKTAVIPLDITIYKVTVPIDENFKIIQGFSSTAVADYHKIERDSEEHKRLNGEYLKMLRRMHQNMLYVGGIKTKEISDGKYEFDFSDMEKFVRTAMSYGYKYFNAPSVGRRKSWKESTILVGNSFDAMSYEGYRYLSQYLPALKAFLNKNGWLDNFYMGIADEPNEENATTFRALCGIVRKLFPEIKLIDAVSYGPIHGSLDVWVPVNSSYDKYQKEFESFRADNDELWFYVCCCPREEGYINRFMDYPLLDSRYLFWGNYKYNLKGYLHWAANVYQPNQDPFTSNCPVHKNADSTTILPSGDTHIIYPGTNSNGIGEPWMSLRLEEHRLGAEEFEILTQLSKYNKKIADALCDNCFKSFKDVEHNPVNFDKNRKAILIEASKYYN